MIAISRNTEAIPGRAETNPSTTRRRRGATEITRSIHLGFDADQDPAASAEQAETFFEVGVDLVVWSNRGPLDVNRLQPLADALIAAGE